MVCIFRPAKHKVRYFNELIWVTNKKNAVINFFCLNGGAKNAIYRHFSIVNSIIFFLGIGACLNNMQFIVSAKILVDYSSSKIKSSHPQVSHKLRAPHF